MQMTAQGASSMASSLTDPNIKLLAGHHVGYEALLLPLAFETKTPASEVLFRQCQRALSAPKVCLVFSAHL